MNGFIENKVYQRDLTQKKITYYLMKINVDIDEAFSSGTHDLLAELQY